MYIWSFKEEGWVGPWVFELKVGLVLGYLAIVHFIGWVLSQDKGVFLVLLKKKVG